MTRAKKTLLTLAGFAAKSLASFISWSSKFEIQHDERRLRAIATGRPVVFATWHGGIAATMTTRFRLQFPYLIAMISRSNDGDVTARVAPGFEVLGVRGSSSRGAVSGTLGFRSALLERAPSGAPRAAILFPDGPRGPRHAAKPGALLLAEEAGGLVVPLVFGLSRRWIARRAWDRHAIPLPFGRIVVRFGEPIDPAAAAAAGLPAPTPEALTRALLELAGGDPLCARDRDAA